MTSCFKTLQEQISSKQAKSEWGLEYKNFPTETVAKYGKGYRWKKYDTVKRTVMAEVDTLVLNTSLLFSCVILDDELNPYENTTGLIIFKD